MHTPTDTETDAPEGLETPEETVADETSALLPKALLGGKEVEPGATITLKVMHVYDDEVEVGLVGSEEESGSQMDRSMAGMDRYSKEM